LKVGKNKGLKSFTWSLDHLEVFCGSIAACNDGDRSGAAAVVFPRWGLAGWDGGGGAEGGGMGLAGGQNDEARRRRRRTQ
jgi:hypothetical protein